MKRNVKLNILFFLFISMISFAGCVNSLNDNNNIASQEINENQNITNTINTNSQTISSEDTYNDAISAYNAFLKGDINAYDFNEIFMSGMININDILVINDGINYTQYALFDMNSDGIPELHLRLTIGAGYSIFTYTNGNVVLWYFDTGYCSPLNNGAILYERLGGGPTHINYRYIILDFYGNVLYELDFYKYDAFIENDVEYNAIYNFDGIDVTKEIWDALTERYLSIKSDSIKWNEMRIDFPAENAGNQSQN